MKKYEISREDQKSHELKKFQQKWQNTVGRNKQRAEHIEYIKALYPDAKSILCLGCRHESEVSQFLKSGFDATGLDFAGTESSLIKIGDAHNLLDYYEKSQFDLVYSSHSLEHMHCANTVLENIREVASMGAFIVLPSKGSLGASHCSVFDIMAAAEDGIDASAQELHSSPLMDDFTALNPYELTFFKNMDYRGGRHDRYMEIGLGLRWHE